MAPVRRTVAITVAALAALLGAAALAIEAQWSLSRSFADGHGVLESWFLFLRFFTILTNIALVALQAATAWRLATGRRLPPGPLYDSMLVYALVTGLTYELLLRGLWSPQDWMFVADNVLHDLAPAAILATWALVVRTAPRQEGFGRRALLWSLAYPASFLLVTIVAGAAGEGYPYDFLNVERIGAGGVAVVSVIFLVVFLALGAVVSAGARALAAPPTRAPAPR